MTREKSIVDATLKALNRDPTVHAIKTHGSAFSVRGTPDIIGCRNGHSFVIEMKQPGGEVRALQPYRIAQWRAAGSWAGIADSVEDAIRISKGDWPSNYWDYC